MNWGTAIVCRDLIRLWMWKYEAGEFTQKLEAYEPVRSDAFRAPPPLPRNARAR